jgi:hypothetical protein
MSFSPVFVMLVVIYRRPTEATQASLVGHPLVGEQKAQKIDELPFEPRIPLCLFYQAWPCFECTALM